jgi:hypothetical protein
MSRIIHLIRSIEDEKSICGKDIIDVVRNIGNEGLGLVRNKITCPDCLDKMKMTKM